MAAQNLAEEQAHYNLFLLREFGFTSLLHAIG